MRTFGFVVGDDALNSTMDTATASPMPCPECVRLRGEIASLTTRFMDIGKELDYEREDHQKYLRELGERRQRELYDYKQQNQNLIEQIADGRAFLPSPPVIIEVNAATVRAKALADAVVELRRKGDSHGGYLIEEMTEREGA